MIGADTNLLVRFLIGDVKEQMHLVSGELEKGEQLYINAAVLTELTWVLTATYKFTKQELAEAYDDLLESESIAFFDHELIARSMAHFVAGSAGFNDCLIAELNKQHNLKTLTFDKKAARLEGMELLG